MKDRNYILISGFGWSGSSAVVDLIREFDGFYVPDMEFRIIKDPYGIDNLYYYLVENWYPSTADAAIKDFQWHAKHWNHINRRLSLMSGLNYQVIFGDEFIEATNDYIDSLVHFQYEDHWWFYDFKRSNFRNLINKVKRRIGVDPYKDDRSNFARPTEEKFILETRCFINRLFDKICQENNAQNVVLDQGIAIQKYETESRYFKNKKAIVVDRDPRDIYTDLCRANYGFGRELAETRDVDKYIFYHEALRKGLDELRNDADVLFVQFEDLIMNYEYMLDKIYRFLDISKNEHSKKLTIFKPEESRKNIGIWKKFLSMKEMKEIETQLQNYLWQQRDYK